MSWESRFKKGKYTEEELEQLETHARNTAGYYHCDMVGAKEQRDKRTRLHNKVVPILVKLRNKNERKGIKK